MPFSFEFEASGDKLVRRELLDMGHRGLDASPAFRVIADDLRHYETERFDSRGYGTWASLMAATVRDKISRHLDPRVLHATLALRNSLTVKGDENQEVVIAPQFLIFGSKVPYARYLQKGTRRMVMRKPLGFLEAQKVAILKRLQRFIVSGRA